MAVRPGCKAEKLDLLGREMADVGRQYNGNRGKIENCVVAVHLCNRREVLAEGEIQVVHCVNRWVRRGFLCGVDPLTDKDDEHRRQWKQLSVTEFLAR